MIALLSANSVTILTFAKDGESCGRTPPTNILGRNVFYQRYVDFERKDELVISIINITNTTVSYSFQT